VDESLTDQLLSAIDSLDLDAMMALLAPDCRLLTVDGRRATGADEVRKLLGEFLGALRSAAHRVTGQWHLDNVWIAEVDASYELRDWLRLGPLPRAFIVRDGPNGLADIRVYGAHERPLTEHRTGEEGMFVGERWIPPL
jgi:hypothetical protein